MQNQRTEISVALAVDGSRRWLHKVSPAIRADLSPRAGEFRMQEQIRIVRPGVEQMHRENVIAIMQQPRVNGEIDFLRDERCAIFARVTTPASIVQTPPETVISPLSPSEIAPEAATFHANPVAAVESAVRT